MAAETFFAPYAIDNANKNYQKETEKGWVILTNFIAVIVEELVYHDGPKTTTNLIIRGERFGGNNEDGTPKPPVQLPEITITAAEFQSGHWIAEKWGVTAIVYPTSNSGTDVRSCIQISSAPTSIRTDIYTHTGWAKIGKTHTYLTTTGGITKKGLNRQIKVQLPQELANFALPDPEPTAEDFAAVVRLVNMGPKNVMWVLLLATIRAALGNNDFAVHLAGRTGTFKSEVSSIFQSFYGLAMDARHLPASWNSTGNALEALCHRTKDALVVVDDFVPQGTSYNVRALQQKADALIRAQGNQAGRSRLTDMSGIQQTYFPRGIIMSTGEDIPEGHSVRGRMMIVELSPGSIDVAKLTEAQKVRIAYPRFLASFVQWWATNPRNEEFKTLKDSYRDQNHGTGHSRTPSIMGDLIATAYILKEYATDNGFFIDRLPVMLENAIQAITVAGQNQAEYLHGTDPVTMFAEIIRSMLAMGQGHMKTKNGGIPKNAPSYGWTQEQTYGEMPTYKSQGPKIGWIDTALDELYFDPNAIGLVKAKSGGKLAVNNATLIKRMVEAGIVTRKDDARQRNTLRVTLEGHVQNVLVLRLSEIMILGDAEQADDGQDAAEPQEETHSDAE